MGNDSQWNSLPSIPSSLGSRPIGTSLGLVYSMSLSKWWKCPFFSFSFCKLRKWSIPNQPSKSSSSPEVSVIAVPRVGLSLDEDVRAVSS